MEPGKIKLLNEGPTLRDQFAVAVLQGEIAAQTEETGLYVSERSDDYIQLARRCYAVADAMLRVRGE